MKGNYNTPVVIFKRHRMMTIQLFSLQILPVGYLEYVGYTQGTILSNMHDDMYLVGLV